MSESSTEPTVTPRAILRGEQHLPQHIGIIMDGNGRWAKLRRLPRVFGHREGVRRVSEIVEECARLKIPALTLYAFSEENWGRPQSEVAFLMRLLNIYLRLERTKLMRNNVQLRVIGDDRRLPETCRGRLQQLSKLLKNNTGMVLTLALSYGGQSEIVDAARRVAAEVASGKMRPEDIDHNVFQAALQTGDMPDLDLLIRTSGEQRLSNFLLWQSAYAELYFTEVLWPDFRVDALHSALADFWRRERRFGRVSPNIEMESAGSTVASVSTSLC